MHRHAVARRSDMHQMTPGLSHLTSESPNHVCHDEHMPVAGDLLGITLGTRKMTLKAKTPKSTHSLAFSAEIYHYQKMGL